MPIEPQEARTAHIPAILCRDKPRTLAEYQKGVIAKYGCLPEAKVLAEMENRVAPIFRQMGIHAPRHISLEGRARLAALRSEEGDKTAKRIWNALSAPATRADIMRATGILETTVKRHLKNLRVCGLATCSKWGGVYVWSIRQEAAE